MLTLNKFPNTIELERISTLRKFSRLYDGDHMPVLGLHDIIKNQYKKEKDIIYLAHNLPAFISDFYGDIVAGNTDKMSFRTGVKDDAQQEFLDEIVYENDLKEKVTDIATEQSEFGHVALLGYLDTEGIYRIITVAQDQYFPQSDGSVVFASYKKDPSDLSGMNLICLTQHYRREGDDCIIERQAWKSDGRGVLTGIFTLEAYNSLFSTSYIDTEKLFNLGDLPIRQIDNGKRSKYGFGKSDYVDIIPQLAEVNERTTHIATQLLKTLDAKMVLPRSMFDADGKVKYFDSYAMETKDDVRPEYISNSNTLIAEAQEHIMNQVKVISTITAVPMFELLKSAMPDRVESLRMSMYSAVRKSDRKRSKIVRALQDLIRIGGQMKSTPFNSDPIIEFSDVLPVDEYIQAQTESTKITSGLSSRKSALMRLEGYSEAEAEEELKNIQEEDKLAGFSNQPPPVIDPNNPPQ